MYSIELIKCHVESISSVDWNILQKLLLELRIVSLYRKLKNTVLSNRY